jgi:hypothetical protein
MGKSKIIYNGQVLIDLTSDTVKEEHLQKGITAHGADGELITGTNDWDMNTQEANAGAAEILLGKKAGVKGQMVTGTMPNNGAVSGKISTKEGQYTVPKGFHDGSGKVSIDETEKSKLVPENIREGVTVLGVEGTMTGTEDANPQTVEVTPSASEQVIVPDTSAGYNYIAQVTVKPIPYDESENSAGGITVTIG